MVSGSAHPSAHAEVSPIRFVMRHYLSSHLLWTAQHLSALAGTIEDAHSGASRHDPEHRSYVLSSIIAAAAFAEATINEIYQDAHDGHGRSKDGYLAPSLSERSMRWPQRGRELARGSGSARSRSGSSCTSTLIGSRSIEAHSRTQMRSSCCNFVTPWCITSQKMLRRTGKPVSRPVYRGSSPIIG